MPPPHSADASEPDTAVRNRPPLGTTPCPVECHKDMSHKRQAAPRAKTPDTLRSVIPFSSFQIPPCSLRQPPRKARKVSQADRKSPPEKPHLQAGFPQSFPLRKGNSASIKTGRFPTGTDSRTDKPPHQRKRNHPAATAWQSHRPSLGRNPDKTVSCLHRKRQEPRSEKSVPRISYCPVPPVLSHRAYSDGHFFSFQKHSTVFVPRAAPPSKEKIP